MNRPVSDLPPRAKPRRSWHRTFLQFSLRTLLGLTAVAALGCWWFVQPKMQEEQLAGKYLTLQRQIRPARESDLALGVFYVREKNATVTEGRYQLRDERRDILASGHYLANQPNGRWTIYHANGHKSAEGRMIDGVRVGIWRTWYDDGHPQSEVTYALVKQIVGPANRETTAADGSLQKIVSRATLGGGKLRDEQIDLPRLAQRHGPARFWHASGKLQCEGPYNRSLRDGRWSFYNDLGQLTEQGEFRLGLREGPWLIRDASTEHSTTIEFLADHPRAEFDRLIAMLKREIASGDLQRQIAAMHRLDDLGFPALPLLMTLLNDVSADVQLMALRRLESLFQASESIGQPLAQFPAETAIAAAERFIDSPDERLARSAAYWLYRIAPARRGDLYQPLLQSARKSSDAKWQAQVLETLYLEDAKRRSTTFVELARVAVRWVPPLPLDSYRDGPLPRLAAGVEDLETVVDGALESRDPLVRRFAVAATHWRIYDGPSQLETLADGKKQYRYEIPARYQELIKRARQDPDESVRAEAERADIRPYFRICSVE